MIYSEEFHDMSDSDIFERMHKGDKQAVDYLMEKYKYLVRQKARTLFLMGGDKDDLIQEGMIGLYKAIRDYKEDKDNSFRNFADLCVSRQMYNAIKASNRKKNIPLNNYISFYTPIHGDNREYEDKFSMVDLIIQDNELNPEEMLIDKENTSMIQYELGKRLSSFEQQVLQMYLGGLSYTQIAEELEKEPKSIDNALQRIKAKLNQILRER
ncbi:RNA polymerase sigma-30 (SigH) subunit [Mobilisporobacter senegalensis]|uniref:RNA polymerase sigma factor SigS n=1 Tax=Mobilisporobacter senegalensis TaxID=1329262 RepID=A0A3N1XHR8_9FIRM|nr:RNA polymerase sporulation sigma factor SigH [Mobilisporobacter senegalensis]ROR26290.1 RNA polymerase sigma-30 (SigH) subunit [Mobilisporobacter senegalensis]